MRRLHPVWWIGLLAVLASGCVLVYREDDEKQQCQDNTDCDKLACEGEDDAKVDKDGHYTCSMKGAFICKEYECVDNPTPPDAGAD